MHTATSYCTYDSLFRFGGRRTTASMPTVVLDTTLHDLYRIDNESGHQPTLIYAPFHVYHRGPFTKYIYHAASQAPADPDATNKAVLKLRHRTMPQRHLFVAGQMAAVFITSSQCESGLSHRAASQMDVDSTQRSSALLPRDQRPTVLFWPRPNDIPLEQGSPIALSRPTDCLAHHPHLVPPDVHYNLLSKRSLALSGLPTPPSTVVDTLLRPEDRKDAAKTQAEARRMLQAVETHQVPFVVKLPQSSGRGTFVVTREEERAELTELLRPQLQHMLELVSEANHMLNPCSMVLQDYIDSEVMTLSFFITRTGRAIFIGCCQKKHNDDGQWTGGSISYARQDEHRQLCQGIMERAAQYLYGRGYHGPAGVDVVTGESRKQHIIGLHARITETFGLGLLAGHFTKRGLNTAIVEAAYFACPRVLFEEAFASEIQEGRIVITAWTYDDSLELGFGAIVVGGANAGETRWQLMQVMNHAVLGLDDIVDCDDDFAS